MSNDITFHNLAADDPAAMNPQRLRVIQGVPNVLRLEDATLTQSGLYRGSPILLRGGSVEGASFMPGHVGVVRARDGSIVNELLLHRRDGTVENFEANAIDIVSESKGAAAPIRLDRAIYLGWYFRHHGHFLIETLARCWALEQLYQPGTPVLFHIAAENNDVGIAQDHFEVFQALSIHSKDIVLLRETYVVNNLIAPLQAATLDTSTHQVMREVYDRISNGLRREPSKPAKARFYISRSRMPYFKKKAANEDEVEAIFRRHGFEIIFPEEMTLADQIALFRDAAIIAGCPGSGIHNAVFNAENAVVLALADVSVPYVPAHQYLLNHLAGVATHFVHCLIPEEIWKNYWVDTRVLERTLDHFAKGRAISVARNRWWEEDRGLPEIERRLLGDRAKVATTGKGTYYDPILRRLLRYTSNQKDGLLLLASFWNTTNIKSENQVELARRLLSIVTWALGIYDFQTLDDRDLACEEELRGNTDFVEFLPTFLELKKSAWRPNRFSSTRERP